MHPEEAEEHLALIRSTMERTTRYTGIPAYACFLAGGLAGAAVIASYALHLDFRAPRGDYGTDCRLATLWGSICAVAILQFVALTWAASRRRGEPAWTHLTSRVTVAVLPGIFVAAVMTVYLARTFQFDILPPLWCLCYGCSCLGLGLYAGWKAQLTGALFCAAGAVGLFWLRSRGIELMAVSFGGFHVLLGILILMGHEHSSARSED